MPRHALLASVDHGKQSSCCPCVSLSWYIAKQSDTCISSCLEMLWLCRVLKPEHGRGYGLQECDMDLWRTVMAAPCIHSAQPAGRHVKEVFRIFQVSAVQQHH